MVARMPGVARSTRVLLSPESIPDIDTGRPVRETLDSRLPHVSAWVAEGSCLLELGWDFNTSTAIRAFDHGGMPWGGGRRADTLDELLIAAENGLVQIVDEWE